MPGRVAPYVSAATFAGERFLHPGAHDRVRVLPEESELVRDATCAALMPELVPVLGDLRAAPAGSNR